MKRTKKREHDVGKKEADVDNKLPQRSELIYLERFVDKRAV